MSTNHTPEQVRAEAYERCAKECESIVAVLRLPEQPEYEGDTRHAERGVLLELAKLFRAMAKAERGDQ